MLAQQLLRELGLQQLGPASAATAAAASATASAIGDDEPDEDAVVPLKQLEKARRDSGAAQQRVDEAFATQAHQGGNAHLAGRRMKARGADGRLLSAEPLYFTPEEMPELRRFMALHDFLGAADPYYELPKTLA